MAPVSPSTNSVDLFPPALTRWMGRATFFPSHSGVACSPDGFQSVLFWGLLRLILVFPLVVDNCTLWYLLQEDSPH